MSTNHELLGRSWAWKIPFDEAVERRAFNDEKYRDSTTLNQRIDHFKSKLDLLVWHHLGFGDVPDIRRHADHGVRLAVDYFWGDWWTAEGLDRLMPLELQRELQFDQPGERRDSFLRGNAGALDRNDPERNLKWFRALQTGLLLGGLTRQWKEVARICSWFDPTIEPEYSAGMVEDELFQWYVAMACQLKPEPENGLDVLINHVKKCRLKRPRLLMAAWESVMADDQAGFDQAFPASVKQFLARADKKTRIASEWVALDQSIIWLIAEHRGLKFPTMSARCVAAVITRQSVGFTD